MRANRTKRNAEGMTQAQQKVWDYIRAYFGQNDQLPPMNAIRENFKWASNNAAVEHCAALEGIGRLERNAAGRYRFKRHAAPCVTVVRDGRAVSLDNAWGRA